MTQQPHPEDIHTRIENTIAILNAEAQTVDEHARHGLHLAIETLRAAEASVTVLESELDLVTAPDLSAAEEAQNLRLQLERAELRIATLEQQLVETREKIELEDQIHATEHDRLQKLEHQSKQMENILETDTQAFGKFMDRALEQDERKGRLKGRD